MKRKEKQEWSESREAIIKLYKAGRRSVGGSNPTWRDLGGRHAETGTDGEEVAAFRGEEEEEES